jgi:sec-independent protein translocase protein TatA
MGNIGPGELLIIALIALLLFGAGRIADIGKGLGQGIKNFKAGLKDADEADGKPALEDAKEAKLLAAKKEAEDAKEAKLLAAKKEAPKEAATKEA